MNAPAAFSATYSDLKLIKGRKVAVVCLEIPIEQAEQFVAAFGMPNPAEEKWVALARLNSTAKPEAEPEPKERQKFSRLRPSAQAALLCEKPSFHTFLRELGFFAATNNDEAAAVVRYYCTVKSRSELDKDDAKARTWFALRDRYDAWAVAS